MNASLKKIDDDRCPGCQRHEVHKYCPAYGTAFYMSGVAYDEELETRMTHIVFNMGYYDSLNDNPYKTFNNILLKQMYKGGWNKPKTFTPN